jgi:peptidylprolyl isomerase
MHRLALVLLVACHAPAAPSLTTAPSGSNEVLAGDALAATLNEIRTIEDHRLSHDPRLIRYLQTAGDPSVLLTALTAAGRIGDPQYIPTITPLLTNAAPTVRARAAYALQLIASPNAAPAVLARLAAQPTDEIELAALIAAAAALQPQGLLPQVETLLLNDSRGAVQAAAAAAWETALATLDPTTATPNPAVLSRLATCTATATGRQADACASALSSASYTWQGLAPWLPIAQLSSTLLTSTSDAAMSSVLYTLRRYPRADAEPILRNALADARPVVRETALTALDLVAWTTIADYTAALSDPSPAMRVVSLDLMLALAPGRFDAPSLARVSTLAASDASEWVRGEALKVWAMVAPDQARPHVTQALSGSLVTQAAAITSLGEMASPADVQALLALAQSPTIALYEPAAAALALLPAAAIPASAHDAIAQMIARAPSAVTIGVLGSAATIAGTMQWTDLAPSLANLYPYFASSAVSEGRGMIDRASIIAGLGALGDTAALPLVHSALTDPEHFVGEQAAATYQQLAKQDVSALVPLNSVVTDLTPTSYEVAQAAAARVVLQLARGDMVVRLLPEAPIGSAKFLAMVQSGFYDGLTFHRVVPGFVAQGGDPTNTGYGTADRLLRDEISPHGHLRGTLGWATDGRDTATSEFFINLVDNPFLDGSYTVFGEVESGMDLADLLEAGEPILHAYMQ